MENILITGGAGYIGNVLISEMQNDYNITILDNLLYGGDSLISNLSKNNIQFQLGDVQDVNLLQKILPKFDVIINLAAVVGYAACRKNPSTAFNTNTNGVKNIINLLSKNQLFIQASTGSNYGVVNGICDENTKLNPLSIYAESKTNAEPIVMNHDNYIIYRFATAFGVSQRLRLDLLINELVYLAYAQKYLAIYESNFMRTFIHVRDIAKSFIFALKNRELMKNNVYNVGSNLLNLSKKQVCEMIKLYLPVEVHYTDFDTDADKRNYIVSYDKINALGFLPSTTVDFGIQELIKIMPLLDIKIKYKN